MKILSIVAIALVFMISMAVGLAQTEAPNVSTPSSPTHTQIPRPVTVGELTTNGPLDPSDIPWKQVIQLGFVACVGITSLLIQYSMLSKVATTASDIIKGSVLVLIITLSVSSLIFGFDDKQIAPIVGLFGTIIGFLLGKADSALDGHNDPKQGPTA